MKIDPRFIDWSKVRNLGGVSVSSGTGISSGAKFTLETTAIALNPEEGTLTIVPELGMFRCKYPHG